MFSVYSYRVKKSVHCNAVVWYHARMFRLLILCCLFVGCSAPQPVVEPEQKNDTREEQVQMVRVIDGDTIVVRMEDGTEEHVRIIGIDAPETHGGTNPDCYAAEATASLKKEIDQSFVTLISQPSDNRDKYNRLLRYIDNEGIDVGALLLRGGYARNYPWFPHPRLSSYAQAEASAKEREVGLWGECVQ